MLKGGVTVNINKISVSNDISLTSVRTDKFKTGVLSLQLFFSVSAQNVAFSSVLCGVLKRGSEKYPRISDVYRRLDHLYAASLDIRTAFNPNEISISVSSEFLNNAYAPCGSDVLDGVIEIAAQTLMFPITDGKAFCASTVSREIETVRSALLSEKNNTQVYSVIRAKELLNRNTPEYPSVEQLLCALDNINEKNLYEFYTELISYAPLDVFYVGESEAQIVADKLKKYFYAFTPTKSLKAVLSEPAASLPFEQVCETMQVSQSKLVLGFHSGVNVAAGDYHAALVFNEIFGASPISKLFMNVREKMGLCYYCSSAYNTYSGVLLVSSGIDGTKREIATEAILGQLEDIKNGKISDAEFDSAKKSLINAYRQSYDNPFDIFSFYSSRMRLGINESIDECISALSRVNMEDVIDVARSVIHDTTFFLEGIGTGDGEEEYDEEL